jgi:hypothetical protein
MEPTTAGVLAAPPEAPGGCASARPMVGQTTSSGKRKRGSEGEEIDDDGHNRHNKESPSEDEDGGGASKGEASSQPPSALPSASLASFLQDEAQYRAFRHAPLPAEVAHTLRRRAEWGAAGGGGVGANQQRFGEEAVRQKQAELDRANNLYKALARKSFQLSVTLLTTQPDPGHADSADNYVGQHPMPSHATTPSSSSPSSTSSSSSTTDIYRTIVLPAGTPHTLMCGELGCFVGSLPARRRNTDAFFACDK